MKETTMKRSGVFDREDILQYDYTTIGGNSLNWFVIRVEEPIKYWDRERGKYFELEQGTGFLLEEEIAYPFALPFSEKQLCPETWEDALSIMENFK